VLNQLTKYLLQYKSVSIPSVGTIQLVQHPPTLDVVDKRILPPFYTAQLKKDDAVPEHQLRFLCRLLNEKRDVVQDDLEKTGRQLQAKLESGGFDWKGIGLIRQSQEPVPIATEALQTITAERILRQDAEHNVLVGDQQKTYRQSTAMQEEVAEPVVANKRSPYITIAWILLLLSVLFIVFLLYQGKFRIGATGSRQSPTSYLQKQAVRPGILFTVST
jgi:hypothetical protein